MNKPVTGQYEYLHSSGVGLDYFTSRIDRVVLFPTGRFTLTVQDRSRLSNAAQSLLSGQQPVVNASETRREGSYTVQGDTVAFRFDDGGMEQGKLSWNGDGMQFGPNFFSKVSDSTMLPPPSRMKKDMDDIAKGMKIAGTLGNMALKAAKTIQGTIQTTQGSGQGQQGQQGQSQPKAPGQWQGQVPPTPAQPNAAPPQYSQNQPVQSASSPPPHVQNQPAQQRNVSPQRPETVFCDQCGTRARPGKRFCSNCGAALPL
jgi:hypothetical protein